MPDPQTTKEPLLTRLEHRANYPENGRVDGVSSAEDWWNAKMEIERLREVVWLYVDPTNIRPAHEPVVARCVQQ